MASTQDSDARPPSKRDDGFQDLTPDERARLAACEPAALDLFYRVYFDRIYGYVRRLLREEHLAEDVTQDIFMHIYKSLGIYDSSRELRPWVFTIATNKLRDYWRSRRYKDTRREANIGEQEGVFAVSHHRGPAAAFEAKEVSALVAGAIDDMPEIMRTTLVMRYFEGMSFKEIGEIVGRNEVAVRKRYSRALEELRVALAEMLESESADSEPGGLGPASSESRNG